MQIQEMLNYKEAPMIEGMQHLTDYDEILEVLRARKSFVQGGYTAGREVLRDTMTVLDGPVHLDRRRLLGRLMSEDAISGYREYALYPAIEQTLADAAAENRGDDGAVHADLVTLSQRCVYRIAARVVGIDGLEQSSSIDRFISYIRAISAGIAADWSTQDPARDAAAGVAALEKYRVEFFEPSRDRRLALIDLGEERPKDLITVMYENWDSAWDPDLALRESGVLISAATQTTAASVVLLALRLRDWLRDHPEDRQRLTDDKEFLRRATYDSLRMTVASPARVRLAIEDVRLASGREIKAGDRVALLFLEAGMDRTRFGDDAARFNPHRETDGTTPWGLAFSGGTHACLGRPMVTGSAKSDVDGTMTAILRRLYEAGLEPEGDPVRDESTHYPMYDSVPVRLERL